MTLSVVVKPEKNYFKLLSVKQHYALDDRELRQLKKRARELQRHYHPDRYKTATPQEQRLAAQFSSHINAATQTLTNPVDRAIHMLGLIGLEAEQIENTINDTAFLMQQMQLREELDHARITNSQLELEGTANKIDAYFLDLQQQFSVLLVELDANALSVGRGFIDDNYSDKLFKLVDKMQFFSKLSGEAQAALTELSV